MLVKIVQGEFAGTDADQKQKPARYSDISREEVEVRLARSGVGEIPVVVNRKSRADRYDE